MKRRFVGWLMLLAFGLILAGCDGGGDGADVDEGSEDYVHSVIRENVKVLTDAHVLDEFYHDDGTEYVKHVLTLGSDAPAINEGDTIVFGPSKKYPRGLMRKVKSVTNQGAGAQVVTYQAGLADVFREIDLSVTQALEPWRVVSAEEAVGEDEKVIRVLHAEEGVTVSTDHDSGEARTASVLSGLKVNLADYSVSAKVKLDGTIHFDLTNHLSINVKEAGIHCEGYWDWHGWHGHCWNVFDLAGGTHFYSELVQTGEIKVTAQAGFSDTISYPLATVELPPIDVQVGPVPLLFIPQITLNLKVVGKVVGGITTGMTYEIDTKSGVEYDGNSWHPIGDITPTVNNIPASVGAYAGVQVSVGPSIGIFLYGVLGPSVTVYPYLEADINDDGVGTIYWGTEGDASFALSVLSMNIFGITYDIFEVKEPLEHF